MYAIQYIPAVKSPPSDQPDQLAQPDADSPDAPLPPPAVPPASQDPTPTHQSGTAPPTTVQPPQPTLSTKRSRRKESKKSQSKQPTATPTPTPHTPPKPPSTGPKKSTPQSATNPPPTSSARAKLSASEQAPTTEAFDRSAWLAAMDAELNQGPAGLFQMILPGPIDGFYVFVVRQKFASLAQEVLKNLAAFLISLLELWRDLKHQRKTCRTWLCLDHYNRTVTKAMTWDQSQHRALSEYERDVDLDQQVEKDDNEWIEKLLAAEQASPEFEGTITIDLSMPAAKDMDNGATVGSAANMAALLENMKADVNDLCTELETAAEELAQAKDARILELEAKMAEQASVTGKHRLSSPSSSKATSSADSGGPPPRRQVAHSSLDAHVNSLPPGNYFGDDSRQKSPHVTRVLFQNVQGLPFPMTHEKQKGLFKCWTNERMGIALLAEVNLQWSAVPRGQKWFDRVKSYTNQGHFSSVLYHEHQEFPTPLAHQWGGCSATLLNKVARRAKSGGKDESGLGRFSLIKIRGRDIRQQESQTDGPPAGPLDLVVVSAYRPNPEGTNEGSVWNYQRNYWLSKGVTMDPRDKLTLDLVDLIKKWKAEGCEILLGIDANEDVSYNSPSSIKLRNQKSKTKR
ncbi:unnamed protein product [Cylindrotheca closterium]|uniref:Uncharacterized protein n=1 Tax=Cylindrotheca closterium TaxID=2856 RepID=A0AAD2FSG3_9STRA|nr:unnamed protein product [Cylindrotheca closterium]